MSDLIAGIDLGTTNSLIGVVDAGFPILLADAEGRRLTPSVVFFPDDPAAEPVAGAAALRWAALRPAQTIYSVKRLMGRRAGEVDAAELPYALGHQTGPLRVVLPGRPEGHSPEEISACILRKLKADAERAFGAPVERAVITVPAYFNDAQRQATVRAGELAGLRVERILNEPTAAALAYGLDRLSDRAHIAVYDLGGGTFDISVLELDAGLFQVLSTNGNTRLGGDDIDAALSAHLAARLALAPGEPAFASLRELARAAKERLSTETAVPVYLPFAEGGANNPRSCQLDRPELETLAAPILERTRAHCLRALADAKLSPTDLDAVILVGGATRMPAVRALVTEIFGREPDISQNPDEAVALGATIQAGILAGSVRDIVLLDVTPLSLGLETFGGLANVIIPRNTTIPTKAGELFTNAVAGQRTVEIHVVQGERERARDNWTLGRFDLDFAPGPRGSARVGVQFEIDANGILHVLARDTKTGVEKRVEMRSAVDVADDRVEQMIAESVEHAFADFDARLLIETQLKSREMLPGVQLALQRVGGLLPGPERARILKLAEEVAAALPLDDLARLKAANTALDAGTQALATLLMEQAMDEALAQKGVL
jgi:molecular chaperone DnaK